MIDRFVRIVGTRIYVPTPNPEWKVRGTVTFKIGDKFVEVPYSIPSSLAWRIRCPWCKTREGKHYRQIPESARKFAEKIEECQLLCDTCNEFYVRWKGLIDPNMPSGGSLTAAQAFRLIRHDVKGRDY